jgi:hypothetical protein
MLKTRDFASDAEVRQLIDAFEAGALSPSHFDHAAHMATGLSYLATMSLEDATARMRQSLLQFTARHGINVYHETVTGFWMRLLHHLAGGPYRDVPLWSRINLIVKRWEHVEAVEAHYSQGLIRSKVAREKWVPPDRLPLGF